jgi:hypothetical protein
LCRFVGSELLSSAGDVGHADVHERGRAARECHSVTGEISMPSSRS